MSSVIIRLYESNCIVDDLIAFRLESNWVHATIEVSGKVYSATSPKVIKVDPTDSDVAIPDRIGIVIEVPLTDLQCLTAMNFLDSKVGLPYDNLSILGWIFRARFIQKPHLYYCFRLVYESLWAARVFPAIGNDFISGDQLLVLIERLYGAKIIYSNIHGPVMAKTPVFEGRYEKAG